MNVDLTGFQADQLGDNAARVQELVDAAAASDDGVPFVLLPVRIETRFAQVEEPIPVPIARLADLAQRLRDAARPLALIAATDLETKRAGSGADHRIFKREVENPMADAVADRLDAADDALAGADALLRDPLDGGQADRDAVVAAAAALRAGLAGAAASIPDLRSGWQRTRLSTRLDEVAAHVAATLGVVESQALPAARLREELAAPAAAAEVGRRDAGERLRLVDARAARAAPATVVRGTESEVAALAERTAVLSHAGLARGAGLYDELLENVKTLGADALKAAELADAATTIPLVPAEWKRELVAAVEDARARIPSANIDLLAAAVAGIRSDDPALDATVVRPDIVVAIPQATRLVEKLHVRIYPDDIAVDTHEEALTETEREAGAAFWRQTAVAGANDEAQRAAWRALCLGRGSRRAAWVARITRPAKWKPTPGARRAERILRLLTTLERRIDEVATAPPGQRLSAITRAADDLVKPLTRIGPFPQWAIDTIRQRYAVVRATFERLDAESRRPPEAGDVAIRNARNALRRSMRKLDLRIGRLRTEREPKFKQPSVGLLKEGGWTRAARSGVLPERFLVVAVRGGTVAHAVAGAPVPQDLKLSIDPAPGAPAGEQFSLDTDGDLVVGESIRWMVDYGEAVAKGMGVTLTITPDEAKQGFDRVYVLGLRGGGAAAGAARLEELLDNHHYGRTGLALIPPGTPTNNTESGAAGYRRLDDPDASFDVERGPSLTDPAQPLSPSANDGLRLARTLGVDPTTLAHVERADGRSSAEALTFNAALYPATIGAWLEEQAGPLISSESRDRLRSFTLGHVASRGLVPSFRAGAQPYGVLPATAYGSFVPDPVEAVGSGTSAAERSRQERFDRILKRLLDELVSDWAQIRRDNVLYATAASVDDVRGHFLELLGLEAVSLQASYRFAVNVAGRHGAASRDPELAFGLPAKAQGSVQTGAQFGPFALLQRFAPVFRDAFGIAGAPPLLDKGQVIDPYVDVYTRIQDSRAYELRLLKRSHELVGPAVGDDPGTYLPALGAATPAALAGQAEQQGTPLLALLARQSLLLEWREAALRILIAEGLLTEEGRIAAGASSHFVVSSLTHRRSLTRWSYLFASLAELDGIQDITLSGTPLFAHLGGGTVPMAAFLTDGGPTGFAAYANGRHAARVGVAAAHAASMSSLGSIPAERLEALLREHIDVASHRLDAWITGLAQRRLAAMRATTPGGAHVGAYGWVEDLRPDVGHPLATNVPAALDGDPSRPIHRDPESQGFIQAPSVNHAVTAAILRSGYLSQRGESDVENRMAVNLSSRRTRLALGLIDGVRAGNRLGALLGYRLERYLHEYHALAGVTLDAVIGPLREAFPSAAGVDAALSPDAAARQVCDGLAIVDAVHRWIATNTGAEAGGKTVYDVLSAGGQFTGYPWGLPQQALPPRTDPAHLDGVVRAIDHVADALDAVGDLVVAEAVHQISLGNHPRAAAVLSAIGEGKAPPRPEVVDTPRTGTPVSHRVLLELPDPAGALPAGWTQIPVTPRAAAEPALNAWMAGLLGPPDKIRLRLEQRADGVDAGDVSVTELGLHALDLVAILGPGLETGLGEIGTRAIASRAPADFDDDAPPPALRVVLERRSSWAADVRGIAEVAPLIEAISALVGRARPATAHDYVLGETGPPGEGDGVDLAELAARVQAARDELAAAGLELARLLAGDPQLGAAVLTTKPREFLDAHADLRPPYWNDRAAWRSALLRVAALGFPAALPVAVYTTRLQVREALGDAAETAYVELVDRLRRADEALAAQPSPSSLDTAARAIFGESFQIMPRVTLRNSGELAEATAAAIADAAEIDGWLQGIGNVREGAGGLSDVLALADANGAAVPAGAVAQLPHAPGEAWLGGALPPSAARAGRLSLAIFEPGALPAEGTSGVALLVDEWTEVIPAASETTGVAVHYDQPDASAPQCILVAVPPQRRGAWRLGELLQTLHETLELAKIRAVELEHLQTTMYGQLLPALTGELVPEALRVQQAGDERVVLDFGANN